MVRCFRTSPCGHWISVLSALAASAVSAQEGVRPGDDRLEPPPFEAPGQPQPELELPPPPAPTPEEERHLSSGARAYVARFDVEGSSVFSAEELAAATAPFAGRWLASEELYRARDAVSQLYHDRGYLTSGAILPDQEVENGVVVLRVVEGSLEEIDVRGTRFMRAGYFRSRLAYAGKTPVNVWRLERALQRLQQDPLIERVTARLEPAQERGKSRLEVVVDEALPARLELAGSNYRSPSIGEYTGETTAVAANILGVADELHFVFEGAEGLRDYDVSYAIPVNRFDTLTSLRFRDSHGDVVLDEFEPLDISSRARSWGASVEQPLFRDVGRELRIGLIGELRESETDVADNEFCTIAGATDCDQDVTALRIFQQFITSAQRSAFAARSSFTLGLDAFGATRNRSSVADGRFFAWLGQLQWVYRLPEAVRESVVVARVDTQLADDPLLSIEKFSVGGARTVRGYRENTLVRDSGVAASVEVRIPILYPPRGALQLWLAPFADLGHAWDENGPGKLETDTIASVGAGLRFRLFDAVSGEFYYGARLSSAPGDDADGLQRHGLHFRVAVDAFAPWR